jgi:hypothetical protein|tara:strand:+ start:33043 stop:33324 length:282 start_codon:yes stop_codon:yes gene_type:complete
MWQIILLLIIDIMILLKTGSGNKSKKVAKTGKEWTVYGTMGCGWTRKQIDYMKEKKIPHVFMDCSKGECEKDVKAYPTLVSPDGEKNVGYKEV